MRWDKWPGLMVIICLAFKNQIAFIGYTNDPNDLLLSFAALCQLLSLPAQRHHCSFVPLRTLQTGFDKQSTQGH